MLPSTPWPWPGFGAASAAAATAIAVRVTLLRSLAFRLSRPHASERPGILPSPIDRPFRIPRRDGDAHAVRPSLPALFLAPLEELLEQALLLIGIVGRGARGL